MNKLNNYKEHWLDFFSDTKRYKTTIENDGDFEIIHVASPDLSNEITIELIMLSDDESYLRMFDIQFFHPLHHGFNKYQRNKANGFDDDKIDFNEENIRFMESFINNYLETGFSEMIYSYNGSHFKSEITILKEGQPETFTWHEKDHMMSNKVQRFLNKSFIKKSRVNSGPWI